MSVCAEVLPTVISPLRVSTWGCGMGDRVECGHVSELLTFAQTPLGKLSSLVPSPTPSFSSFAVHVRRCTRPSPLYRTASDEKLGVGLGMRLQIELTHDPKLFISLSFLAVGPHFLFLRS